MSKFYVAHAGCEKSRQGTLALCTYAFYEGGSEPFRFGLGCYAEPQLMLAEARVRIFSDAIIEDVPEVVIVTSAPGIKLYSDNHVWEWLRKNEVAARENGPLWKEHLEFESLISKVDTRLPQNLLERKCLRKAQEFNRTFVLGLGRNEVRKNPSLLSTQGVFKTDKDTKPSATPMRDQ